MKVKINIILLICALIFGGVAYYIWELERHSDVDINKNGVVDLSLLGSDVKSVGIKFKDWNVEASNINGRWYILSPVYDLAKQGIFESVFSMVERLKFQEVITPEEMKKRQLSEQTFGIDNPEAVITLVFQSESVDVVFGKRTRLGDYIYVKNSGSGNIYTVSSKIIDVLPLTVNELRDCEMFSIDTSLVNVIKIKSSKAGYVELIKRGRKWFFDQPDIGAVEERILQTILEKLTALRVDNCVWQDSFANVSSDENNILYEKYGLTDAHVLFEISLEDPIIGDTYSLRISQRTLENQNLYYVIRKELPNIYSVNINEKDINILNFSLNDLKNKELFRVDGDEVTKICISKSDERFTMTRTNGFWAIVEPAYAIADLRTISSFLNYFTKQVRIIQFLSPDVINSLELEPYVDLSIGVHSEILPNGRVQFFTSKQKPENFYGKFIDNDEVFLLPFEAKLVFGSDVVDPFLFYNKTVLSIASQDISRLSVHKRGQDVQSAVLSDDGQWKIDGSSANIDLVAVKSILFSVANLRADCIIDDNTLNLEDYGLKDPFYIVKIGFSTDAGIQKSLLIGSLAGGDGARYAMVQGSDLIFILSLAELSNLTLELYKERPLMQNEEVSFSIGR